MGQVGLEWKILAEEAVQEQDPEKIHGASSRIADRALEVPLICAKSRPKQPWSAEQHDFLSREWRHLLHSRVQAACVVLHAVFRRGLAIRSVSSIFLAERHSLSSEVLARRTGKDVDHKIHIVNQHPLGLPVAYQYCSDKPRCA